MKDFMKINENDNVIVALKEMKKGEKISLEMSRFAQNVTELRAKRN